VCVWKWVCVCACVYHSICEWMCVSEWVSVCVCEYACLYVCVRESVNSCMGVHVCMWEGDRRNFLDRQIIRRAEAWDGVTRPPLVWIENQQKQKQKDQNDNVMQFCRENPKNFFPLSLKYVLMFYFIRMTKHCFKMS